MDNLVLIQTVALVFPALALAIGAVWSSAKHSQRQSEMLETIQEQEKAIGGALKTINEHSIAVAVNSEARANADARLIRIEHKVDRLVDRLLEK